MTRSSPGEMEKGGSGGSGLACGCSCSCGMRGRQTPRRWREAGQGRTAPAAAQGGVRTRGPRGANRRGGGAGPARPEPPATNLWPKAGCSCAQLGMQMYANLHCPGRGLVASSVKGWGKGRSTVSALPLPKGAQTRVGVGCIFSGVQRSIVTNVGSRPCPR